MSRTAHPLRADAGARSVFEHLKEHGASKAFLKRLTSDLRGLPAEFERRMANWTRGERAGRVTDLANATRKLSRAWSRHPIGQHWSILPHLVQQGGKVRCDRLEVLTNGRVVDMPTIAEFLTSLAEAVDEAARQGEFGLLHRRMKLEAYAVLWCAGRLAETGLYKRRPIAHAAALASAATGTLVSVQQAKKIIARAAR